MNVHIAIADDHQLFLKSVGQLIDSLPDFCLVADAGNGSDLLQKIALLPQLPDIVLLDVNMPVMDGPATAAALSKKHAHLKMVALSMKNDDATIIRMIRSGCCAYLLKDIHPDDLEKALLQVHQFGYYNADESNIRIRRLLQQQNADEALVLRDREKTFLKLACSDLTYKQIASHMHLAERTIDGYREHLFEKLQVQNRVGMVLKALRKGLVQLDEEDDH
jgi:DNA-binding NarL/FixJ family response regulator